jgi:hypothetical protein
VSLHVISNAYGIYKYGKKNAARNGNSLNRPWHLKHKYNAKILKKTCSHINPDPIIVVVVVPSILVSVV